MAKSRVPSPANRTVRQVFLEHPGELLTEAQVLQKLGLSSSERGRINHHLRTLVADGFLHQEGRRGAYALVRNEQLGARVLRAFMGEPLHENELQIRLGKPKPSIETLRAVLQQLAAMGWIEPHPHGQRNPFDTVLVIGGDGADFLDGWPFWRLTALGASKDERCHICGQAWGNGPLIMTESWATRFAVSRTGIPKLPPREAVAVHAECHARSQSRGILRDDTVLCTVCALPLVPRAPRWRHVGLADVAPSLGEADWSYAKRLALAASRERRVQIRDEGPSQVADQLPWEEVVKLSESDDSSDVAKCARLRLLDALTKPLWPQQNADTIARILNTREEAAVDAALLSTAAKTLREESAARESEAWTQLLGPAGIIHAASANEWMGNGRQAGHQRSPLFDASRPQTLAYRTATGWAHPACRTHTIIGAPSVNKERDAK